MSLWPNNNKLEIIGVTGGTSSGKTTFLLSIAPVKRTLLYDMEKSSSTQSNLGFDRIDVPAEMQKKYPQGFTQLQLFMWWAKHIRSVKAGKYDCIAVDPLPSLEDGMVDWVSSRHAQFGFSTKEAFESTRGIRWAKVKSEWNRCLLDISSKCETFAFSAHMKNVWKHKQPTGEQAPQGKDVLMLLSSLYILLDRHDYKDIPSGHVLKSRLSNITLKDGMIDQVFPMLPPRLSVATPAAIREYMMNPPDYRNLKDGEKACERELSSDEKLIISAQIAEDKKQAASAEFATQELRDSKEAKLSEGRKKAAEKLVKKEDKEKEKEKEKTAVAKPRPVSQSPGTELPKETGEKGGGDKEFTASQLKEAEEDKEEKMKTARRAIDSTSPVTAEEAEKREKKREELHKTDISRTMRESAEWVSDVSKTMRESAEKTRKNEKNGRATPAMISCLRKKAKLKGVEKRVTEALPKNPSVQTVMDFDKQLDSM